MTIDHLAVLRAESELVAQLARTVPHDAAVPHLTEWTVHDVLAHLVGDVDWVLATIAARRVAPGGIVASAARGSGLCDEWDDRTRRLLDTLADADPDEPCPNFVQGAAGRIGFHVRHQAFETTIHRWDIESATERTPRSTARWPWTRSTSCSPRTRCGTHRTARARRRAHHRPGRPGRCAPASRGPAHRVSGPLRRRRR